ncbi:MAG: lamin tail domain-containing protein [Anaerolineae bacterium]|nr:lamin tail domain-containing protein [Anaerolineae bacterium]
MGKRYALLTVVTVVLIGVFLFGANLTGSTIYGQLTPTIPAYLPIIFNPPPTPTFTPTPIPTQTPMATATVPGPTSTPTRTPTAPAPAQIKITFILYGPTNGPLEEYVTIANLGGTAQTMTNWTLRDEANHVFTFPTFTLSPGAQVNVWTKSGSNTATNLYWNSAQAIWNNGGDTAFLRNAAGALISTCTYAGGGISHTCP